MNLKGNYTDIETIKQRKRKANSEGRLRLRVKNGQSITLVSSKNSSIVNKNNWESPILKQR